MNLLSKRFARFQNRTSRRSSEWSSSKWSPTIQKSNYQSGITLTTQLNQSTSVTSRMILLLDPNCITTHKLLISTASAAHATLFVYLRRFVVAVVLPTD